MALKERYTPEPEQYEELLGREEVSRRVNHVAGLLDDAFRVPGTRFRFGWDAILGIVPGVGDFVTVMAAFYIVIEALAASAPPSILLRMIANIAIDAAIGSVPLSGDLGDFAWKANRRNSRLLIHFLNSPESAQRRSRLWITTGILILTATLAGGLYLAWLFAFAVFNYINNNYL